jgi:hypothetical protein
MVLCSAQNEGGQYPSRDSGDERPDYQRPSLRSAMIELKPTAEHPIPFDLSDEQPKTHADSVAIAINTADLIEQLDGSLDYDDKALNQAGKLITGAEKSATPRTVSVSAEAKAASVLVKQFDFQAFSDQLQARNFITNKLITLADSGDPKVELKALELLGKHSDIGLFTERSEITIHHTTSSSLENSIKERIKRLMNADVTDIKPNLVDTLDELDEIEAQKGQIIEEEPKKDPE